MDSNDLMTISVTIRMNAVVTNGDRESPVEEYCEETFGGGDADAEDTLAYLGELTEAVEQGKLYGWLQQRLLDSKIHSGDLRAETPDEAFSRIKQEHGHGHEQRSEAES